MFHLLGYTTTFAGAATLQDMSAATDSSFTQQNSHYIFTEDFRLLAAQVTGALNTAAEFKISSWNAIAPMNIYPVNLAVTEAANPNVFDLRAFAPMIPQNEQLQVLASASGAEQENAFLWIGTPNWNSRLSGFPMGGNTNDTNVGRRLLLNVTGAVTKIANAWSADGAVTFEQSLRGGSYAVLGAYGQVAGTLAFRLNFVRQKQYDSRKLFPGDLCIQAYGNQPHWRAPNWLGMWGAFHTFEPPLVEVWGNAAGAATLQMFWDVVYLGRDESLVDQFYQGFAA
jgi:hypothetical protein